MTRSRQRSFESDRFASKTSAGKSEMTVFRSKKDSHLMIYALNNTQALLFTLSVTNSKTNDEDKKKGDQYEMGKQKEPASQWHS